jgi:hypothetical protein
MPPRRAAAVKAQKERSPNYQGNSGNDEDDARNWLGAGSIVARTI